MIILDTDHLTILYFVEHPRCGELKERLQLCDETVEITAVSVEEQMRGWLAEIRRSKDILDQIPAYDRLVGTIGFFQQWDISPLNARAAAEFSRLKKMKIRIGTQDLKIAAICLANDALLLSANVRDFQQVPGLRVENWLP